MKVLIIFLVITIIGFFIFRNKKTSEKNLKELVKKAFPKHVIIEKFGTVMICEINHRNEPDELVFIRINPNKKKNISKNGRRLNAEYPTIPKASELKTDFQNHLK